MTVSFYVLGEFSDIISLNIFSVLFSLFSFWETYNANVDVFSIYPNGLLAVFISLQYILFILFHGMVSTILSSTSLIHLPQLFCYLIPPSVLLISVILLFNSVH